MSIRLNFIQWLLKQSAVFERVKQRVWPLKRPGGEGDVLPCIVVDKRNAEHTDDLSGTTDHRVHKFRISILAETYEEADEIFEGLAGERDPLRKTGILSGYYAVDMEGQRVAEICVEGDFDGTDTEHLFDNNQTYIISLDVKVVTQGGA